jgi:hypothetical protein
MLSLQALQGDNKWLISLKCNPFAERAGMRKIAESEPSPHGMHVAEELEKLGFDLRLLTSQTYALNELRQLSESQLAELKDVFRRYGHPSFRDTMGALKRAADGTKRDYGEQLEKASLERMAQLIKETGILLQTKVYLFWDALGAA